MNVNQHALMTQMVSRKLTQSKSERTTVTKVRSNLNTPILSKNQCIPSSFQINTVQDLEESQKFPDPKIHRVKRIKQITYDSDPKLQNKQGSLLTLQTDTDVATYIQNVQTTRTMRLNQINQKSTLNTPKKVPLLSEQSTKQLFRQEPNNNEKILDLLLLSTQQLKNVFEKVQPSQKRKPRIASNNMKFPNDFFSMQ